MVNRYRVGRRLDEDDPALSGRTLYLQVGDDPSFDDVCLGVFDDCGFAAHVAATLNEVAMSRYGYQFDHQMVGGDGASAYERSA